MNFKKTVLTAMVVVVTTSLAVSTSYGLSMSLRALASQFGTTWDAEHQNSDLVWFFSIVDPPSSNDIAAFQAVGVPTTGLTITKDEDPEGGTTTPSLNGIDNGDGTISWTSSYLPSHIAFKFGRDWYSVWTTGDASFDGSVWSDTIKIGDAPHGSLSHTAILPDGGITLILFGIGLVFLAGFHRKLAKT